jgi:PAS domain S-box-containing protein
MSAPLLLTPEGQDNPSADPAVEAAHLRRLIEGQPTCLMRLDDEGRLLAANGAALGLLGATLLEEALGRSLRDQIAPEHQGRWRDFADRVSSGVPSSVECDLTDFSGADRVVLLQGVPLLDHPDGVPSMLVTARDIFASRNLEQVLVEREVEIEIDAAIEEQQRVERMQQDAQAGRIEQERLGRLLAEHEVQRTALIERHAAEQANLRQSLAEEHQLAVLILERDARLRVEAANKELEQARSEQQRLTGLVEAAEGARESLQAELARREADTQGFASDRAAEEVRLQDALERMRAEISSKDQAWQRQLDERQADVARLTEELADARQAARSSAEQHSGREVVQRALDEARLECGRLRSVLDHQDAERQRLAQVHAAALDNLRATLVEERELAVLVKEREARQRIDEAEAGLARALEERQRLRTVLQDSEVERERVLAEQAAQRIETEHALALAATAREQLTKAFADQQVELQALVGSSRSLEAAAGAGRIAREVGRELQEASSSIDRRARQLLERSSVDAGERQEIEALRVDAVAITSLARQILEPRPGPASGPNDGAQAGAEGLDRNDPQPRSE